MAGFDEFSRVESLWTGLVGMWITAFGEVRQADMPIEKIFAPHLLTALMAIFQIKDKDRIGVEPKVAKSRERKANRENIDEFPEDAQSDTVDAPASICNSEQQVLEFGWLDEKNQLLFTAQQASRI